MPSPGSFTDTALSDDGRQYSKDGFTQDELSEQHEAIINSIKRYIAKTEERQLDDLAIKLESTSLEPSENMPIDGPSERLLNELNDTLNYWEKDAHVRERCTSLEEVFKPPRAKRSTIAHTISILELHLDGEFEMFKKDEEEQHAGYESSEEESEILTKHYDSVYQAKNRLERITGEVYRTPKRVPSPELTRTPLKAYDVLTRFIEAEDQTTGHEIIASYISEHLDEARRVAHELTRDRDVALTDEERKPLIKSEQDLQKVDLDLISLVNWWDGFESSCRKGEYRADKSDITKLELSLEAFAQNTTDHTAKKDWHFTCGVVHFLEQTHNDMEQEDVGRFKFDDHATALAKINRYVRSMKMYDSESKSMSSSMVFHEPLLSKFAPTESLKNIPKDWFEDEYHLRVIDGTLTSTAKADKMSIDEMKPYQACVKAMSDIWTAASLSAKEKLQALGGEDDNDENNAEDLEVLKGQVDELGSTVERYKECQEALAESISRASTSGGG